MTLRVSPSLIQQLPKVVLVPQKIRIIGLLGSHGCVDHQTIERFRLLRMAPFPEQVCHAVHCPQGDAVLLAQDLRGEFKSLLDIALRFVQCAQSEVDVADAQKCLQIFRVLAIRKSTVPGQELLEVPHRSF